MTQIEFLKDQCIAFDGDSLTALRKRECQDQWPWLRISASHRSWADVFSELVFSWRPELNLSFRTVAIGGSTCRDVLNRFEANIVPIRPAWTFMTMGPNDCNQEIPLEEYKEKLSEYAQGLSAWGGKLILFVDRSEAPNATPWNDKIKNNLQGYYDTMKSLSLEVDNIQCISPFAGLKEKAEALYEQYAGHNIYSDGNHYSHLGAIVLAGEVLKEVGIVN
ncbi:MAG: hypothetical protein HRU15_03630 [Planctomycetes bacterium]|nr:hypothetical protein [Planctomycetota bacterium]